MCMLRGDWNSVKPTAKLLVTTAAQCHPHLQTAAQNKAGMHWCLHTADQDRAVYWKQLHPSTKLSRTVPKQARSAPKLSQTCPNGPTLSHNVPNCHKMDWTFFKLSSNCSWLTQTIPIYIQIGPQMSKMSQTVSNRPRLLPAISKVHQHCTKMFKQSLKCPKLSLTTLKETICKLSPNICRWSLILPNSLKSLQIPQTVPTPPKLCQSRHFYNCTKHPPTCAKILLSPKCPLSF